MKILEGLTGHRQYNDREDVAPKWFLSRLDPLCYALRHLVQHTGEINALLRQADAPVGGW